MTKQLFNQFENVSAKEWKQKIQVDLKGADYNETLIWNSPEGISVKPFYNKEDYSVIPQVSDSYADSWKVCEKINVNTSEEANQKAITSISKGAESLHFVINNEDCDIVKLLAKIDTSSIPVYFETNFISSKFTAQLNDFAAINNSNFYLLNDIVGNLARTGNWFDNLESDHKQLEESIEKSNNLKSALSVDSTLYQNAGATVVQQLAYMLAHSNEYLNHFKDSGLKSIVFKVSVGSNYFFELAKLRALRDVFSSLLSAYNQEVECHIIAEPSKRNKTIYDYNVNMLRTTTECMSAILGGANTVSNMAYDGIFHQDNEFGSRISRNQLLILKSESYFNKVNNPVDGTYYIEELTEELSTKALELFKDIEANGGFLSQLKEGTIQRKIKESAEKELQQFNDNEVVLLGTNKHPNENDKMKNELQKEAFVTQNVRKTLLEPIIEKRLAEELEKERLSQE